MRESGGAGRWRCRAPWRLWMIFLLQAWVWRLSGHDWHRHDEAPAPAPAAKIRMRSLPKSKTPEAAARADLMAETFGRDLLIRPVSTWQ